MMSLVKSLVLDFHCLIKSRNTKFKKGTEKNAGLGIKIDVTIKTVVPIFINTPINQTEDTAAMRI